jgi:hypothetical protein
LGPVMQDPEARLAALEQAVRAHLLGY